jgi:ubiquinol-cytochrome c reductase cytochrome b subunit
MSAPTRASNHQHQGIRNNAMGGERSSYRPGTAIGRWFDARLPLPRLVHDSFIVYPVPRNLNYAYTFGGILTMMLGVQIATGIVLAMHYAANTTLAFGSVEQIMRDVNSGWLLRYLHSNGASFFFIAAYTHMLRGLYYGSFKAPRELLWILGCINFLLLMAIAFLGYTLPWGQMSFWGATVITGFFSAIPLVGGWIQELLLGGFAVGNPTLNRFFALHYLLPFILIGVVALHIWALHVVGQNNPTGIDVKSKTDVVDFTPHATVKDIFGAVTFLVVFAYFVFYVPNFLGHPDNYTIANPLKTPAHIIPEWYFLPFYAMLRSVTFSIGPIDSKLGGVLTMFAAIVVLFLVPWLDTSKVRSAVYRPWYRRIFWLFVADAIFLGWLGSQPAEGGYVLLSQLATLGYFAFFLVAMPLLGVIETPRPLPHSITEAVLDGQRAGNGESTLTPESGGAKEHP